MKLNLQRLEKRKVYFNFGESAFWSRKKWLNFQSLLSFFLSFLFLFIYLFFLNFSLLEFYFQCIAALDENDFPEWVWQIIIQIPVHSFLLLSSFSYGSCIFVPKKGTLSAFKLRFWDFNYFKAFLVRVSDNNLSASVLLF